MKKLLSCKFNIGTAYVELKYSDGSMLSIDCDAVEEEYAKPFASAPRLPIWSTTPRWNTQSWSCAGARRGI